MHNILLFSVMHYTKADKKKISAMFNNISHRYDLLNRCLSWGFDILWRKKAITLLQSKQPQLILDVATGTGDFSIAALKLNPKKIIGIDIAKNMLALGNKKIKKRGVTEKIKLELGDIMQLQYECNKFDAVISAFGVRNFSNLSKGLAEMYRVLKYDGTIVIIEFSRVNIRFIRFFFDLYFQYCLPIIGRIISRDKKAYTYLYTSVQQFFSVNQFIEQLKKTGFQNIQINSLYFGICTIYMAEK